MRRNDRSASPRRMIVALPAALLTLALGACGNDGTTVATPTTSLPSTSRPVGTGSPTSRPSSHTTTKRPKQRSTTSRTHRPSSTTKKSGHQPPPSSSTTSTAPKAPARFGAMTDGAHHSVDVSGDGQAMTVTFDDLEVGLGNPELQSSRTWEFDVPLTGAVTGRSLRVFASGYVLTADHVSATVTVSACGHQQTATYGPGSDDEPVLQVPSIPLAAGLTRCHVTVTLDVVQGRASTESSDGYLNVTALDAELV